MSVPSKSTTSGMHSVRKVRASHQSATPIPAQRGSFLDTYSSAYHSSADWEKCKLWRKLNSFLFPNSSSGRNSGYVDLQTITSRCASDSPPQLGTGSNSTHCKRQSSDRQKLSSPKVRSVSGTLLVVHRRRWLTSLYRAQHLTPQLARQLPSSFENPTIQASKAAASLSQVTGWGCHYLFTVLDDFSRYIVAWRRCTTMASADATACRAISSMPSNASWTTTIHLRYHQALDNLTPADVYFECGKNIPDRKEHQTTHHRAATQAAVQNSRMNQNPMSRNSLRSNTQVST